MKHALKPLLTIGLVIVAIAVFVFLGYRPEISVSFVKQWIDAIETLLAMEPIYPLREDVQVGDVYLSIDPSAVAPQLVAPRKIGHVDVKDLLQQYYSSRPELPELISGRPAGPASNAAPAQVRLRQVAIPGFRVLRTDDRAGSGQAPGRLFGFKLDSRSANSTSVSISLSDVREIAAPDDNVMINRITSFCQSPDGFLTFNEDRLKFSLGQMIDVTNKDKLNSARPSILIVSRVLYAGAIDLAISGSTLLSGSSQGGAKNKEKESEATNSREKGTSGAGQDELRESPQAKALGTSMGIAANLAFGDQEAIVLRQTFNAPMAFAVGGVSVKAIGEGALKNCDIVKASGGAISGRFLSGREN